MTPDELKTYVHNATERVGFLEKFLKIEECRTKKATFDEKMSAPDFWNSRERAQETIDGMTACKNIIEPFDILKKEFSDFTALAELVEESGYVQLLTDAEKSWTDISSSLGKIELISYLSGKFDRNNAYFTVNAGAGGTESCDWAAILLRMYRRWFERKGFKEEIVDMQPGEEAGVKRVTLFVTGEFAYGYLKAERGVHRLVRISPFDSNARRHTSFASVDILPELSDDFELEIDESELKIDTYRASGAGGQHVNRTDSAVRITHIPTGIMVSCQMERSQHKNRATSMKMLKAKLYELHEEEKKKEANALRGEKADIAWGNQIRSYVLHPYQMIKDTRTGVETGNSAAVLDGDLDRFVEAWLKSGIGR